MPLVPNFLEPRANIFRTLTLDPTLMADNSMHLAVLLGVVHSCCQIKKNREKANKAVPFGLAKSTANEAMPTLQPRFE